MIARSAGEFYVKSKRAQSAHSPPKTRESPHISVQKTSFVTGRGACYNDHDWPARRVRSAGGMTILEYFKRGTLHMKKWICAVLALCLCALCALAETGDTYTVWFEDAFSLNLPEGWVSYPVAEEDARAGILYALGDESGERLLYIQRQTVTTLDSFDALKGVLEAREDCDKVQELDLNGQAFASFIMAGENVSGCATLLGGDVLTFLFQPQDNADYIMQVTEIMESFRAA